MINLSIQDALLTIHRNQQTIDLLTANNTQLTNYLLALSVQHQPQYVGPPQLFREVPDQNQPKKRGRPPKQLLAALQPAAAVFQPAPEPHDNRAWTDERRAKQAATLARKRKSGGEVRWSAAQKKEIGERSRQAWARRRAQGIETRNQGTVKQKNTWGGKRVKGQSSK